VAVTSLSIVKLFVFNKPGGGGAVSESEGTSRTIANYQTLTRYPADQMYTTATSRPGRGILLDGGGPYFRPTEVRMRQLLFVLVAGTLAWPQQPIAIAPVPSDPHELVTGVVKVLDETDQRATVLGLIERARQNSDLHAPAGHPYDLKVSFEAAGDVLQTGPGQMEEIWLEPFKWRWTSTFGSYTDTRLMAGRMYDENPAFLPLRLQMVRGTVFWPIHTGPNELLRIAPGTWNGSPVMCVLSSFPRFQANKVTGRSWEESEFCIDTKSGLLQTYSVAPGIYAVYDYQNAIHFHASLLPKTITIYESGNVILIVHLDSIVDAGEPDPNLVTPTPKMASQGTGPVIAGQMHFLAPGGTSPVPTGGMIQPVIIHALLDPEGKVQEAEALQTSEPSLSSTALSLVKNSTFARQSEGRALQREAFIDVRFTPPPQPSPQGGQQ